ncbi:MAG: universal stress protein [Verrucomicrobiales bacterium]|nr:universal stress protein [Verrucomicrobiales bacterium]
MEETQDDVVVIGNGLEKGPIVVAVDSSSVSSHALAEAVRIAATTGAEVYAVNYIYDEEMETFCRWLPGQKDALIAGRKSRLEKWIDELDFVKQNIKIHVSTGHPFSELTKLVSGLEPALFVIGMKGIGEENGGHSAGYLAKACLGDGSTDVMFVRTQGDGPFRKIVVGIDFSPNSRTALRKAASLAVAEGCPLYVIHIFSPNWENFGNPGDFSNDIDEYLAGLVDTFDQWIEEDLSDLKGLDASFTIRKTLDPHAGITSYATEIGADLIVIGLVGRGHQFYRYAGSTAQKVLEGSDCSVLAVKAGFSS